MKYKLIAQLIVLCAFLFLWLPFSINKIYPQMQDHLFLFILLNIGVGYFARLIYDIIFD